MLLVAEETRVQIERLVKADPTLSAAQLARAVGVSRQRASKILEDLGYELQSRWVKKRREREE
jgi:predicted ArsR family transcriptional regulator